MFEIKLKYFWFRISELLHQLSAAKYLYYFLSTHWEQQIVNRCIRCSWEQVIN